MNIVFFNCSVEHPLLNEVIGHYSTNGGLTHEFILESAEADQYIKSVGSCIVIFTIRNKDELVKTVNLLKIMKNLMKKGSVKIAGFNETKNPKVDEILQKNGVMEIINQSINFKSMKYKIDIWNKGLVKEAPKTEAGMTDKTKDGKKAGAAAGAPAAQAKESNSPIQWTEALDLEDDCWILKKEDDCKAVLKKWLVKSLGPGPSLGKWEQTSNGKAGSGPQYWAWMPRVNKVDESFFTNNGRWYFQGTKPEFDWAVQRWTFAGDNIMLFFQTAKGENLIRFQSQDRKMNISKNSEYALTKESLMVASFNQEIEEKSDNKIATDDSKNSFSKEKNEGKELNATQTRNTPNLNPLRGDSSGESIDKFYQGKNGSGPEGDLGGNMEGEAGTDKLDGGPLKGDAGAADRLDKAPMIGKMGPITNASGPLSGEAGTDKLENGPMSGEAGGANQINRAPLIGKMGPTISSDEADDTNGGGTDRLDRTPLVGKSGPNKASNGPLSGDGASADEIDTGPLIGSINGDAAAAGANSRSKKKELMNKLGQFYDEAAPVESRPDVLPSYITDDELEDISLESGELIIKLFSVRDGQTPVQVAIALKLLDFFEQDITFMAPKTAELDSTKKTLELCFLYNNQKKVIKMDATLETIDRPEEEEGSIISFKLGPYPAEDAAQFLEAYQARQESIELFLKMAKGY